MCWVWNGVAKSCPRAFSWFAAQFSPGACSRGPRPDPLPSGSFPVLTLFRADHTDHTASLLTPLPGSPPPAG